MPAVFDFDLAEQLFKDRRLGRETPPEMAQTPAKHTQAFYEIEAHSMLELEPPRHTRLRGLVLRAFTSRKIAALGPDIAHVCHALIDGFEPETNLIETYATRIPVIVIAKLLGVPPSMADQLLIWSNKMVMMYQARRTHALETEAATAAREFAAFMRQYITARRQSPADDLITHLIAAEEEGNRLSTDELISTCILLLNAGHEATVHTMGNGIKTLLETGTAQSALTPERIEQTVEEILRFDPPLHMFTRTAYEEVTIGDLHLKRGDQVALMIGASGRDPKRWERPAQFDPRRPVQKNLAFGGGIHFCLGAPLARLELAIALPILFERCPDLTLTGAPRYANLYHFHGLERLDVTLKKPPRERRL